MSKLEQILHEYGQPIPPRPAPAQAEPEPGPDPAVIEGDFEAQDAATEPDIFDGGADATRLPMPEGGNDE